MSREREEFDHQLGNPVTEHSHLCSKQGIAEL
jgi:hypothetical protein